MDTASLLSPAQVATRLGLSAKSVRRLAAAGLIPSVRLSPRIIRFEPNDIDAFIEARRTTDHAGVVTLADGRTLGPPAKQAAS